MKITKKVQKSAVAQVVSASKKAVASVVKASKTVAKEVKNVGLSVMDAYSVAHCKQALKEGLDGAGAWLGTEINDTLVATLVKHREEISSTRLAKTDRVLFVSTKRAYAWALTGFSGDTYERLSDKKPVRGSVSALRKAYGASNVKIVSKQEAIKLLKTLTPDKGCAAALGVTA